MGQKGLEMIDKQLIEISPLWSTRAVLGFYRRRHHHLDNSLHTSLAVVLGADPRDKQEDGPSAEGVIGSHARSLRWVETFFVLERYLEGWMDE